MVAKKRESRGEAFWRRVLRRRAKSGMTVAKFCASEDLPESAFYYWQRQIRRRDAKSPTENANSDAAPAFLPVQLLDDRNGTAPVEIVAPNGYVIRVREAATTEHVRRMLQAVGTAD